MNLSANQLKENFSSLRSFVEEFPDLFIWMEVAPISDRGKDYVKCEFIKLLENIAVRA